MLSESKEVGLCKVYFFLICSFSVYKNGAHPCQEIFWWGEWNQI